MATTHQRQRSELEQKQSHEQHQFNSQVGSLQLELGEQAHSWLALQNSQSPAMLQLTSNAVMPPLGSPSSSRDSSPGRCSIEDLGLVMDGDYPSFDEEEFKTDLAKLLHIEVSVGDIDVELATGSSEAVARVRTGSCEVRVKCFISGGRTMDCATDERRIKACVKEAIEQNWPSGVAATVAKPKVKWMGSVILVLELPQPLPVLLMQMAKQGSTKLLEAVPGLLCGQLGDSVVRLEGCKKKSVDKLAEAMKHAKRMPVQPLPMSKEDAFALLGVTREDSFHTAKTAYYTKLRKHHPDKNPGDVENATKTTQEITVAWTAICEHFAEPERPIEPDPKKQRTKALERPSCTPAQITKVIQSLGIGRSIDDLMKRSEKNQQSSGLNLKYIEATKCTPVRYRARYQGISVRVDKNVEFTCGAYPTQEEAAIAVNLCKKRLGDIGAETYTDIEKILNFDKKAFAKDIQDEVEKAIHHVFNRS